jgi:hypothetical protein
LLHSFRPQGKAFESVRDQMTSRAQTIQEGVARIFNAVSPTNEGWVKVADNPQMPIDDLLLGVPMGVAMKAGMTSERVARNVFQRTYKTAVVLRCLCNGARFATSDQFVEFIERAAEYCETVCSPLRITKCAIEVQTDPEEFEQNGITSTLVMVEAMEWPAL